MAKGFLSSVKGFDAFGKTMEDVKIKTRTGALLTIISAAIICTFTLIEFIDYRKVYIDTSVIVDRSRGEKLLVTMNITFPQVPCYLVNTKKAWNTPWSKHGWIRGYNRSTMEGQTKAHLKNELDKLVASRGADYCGSCYGGLPPESGCCQTCEDVRQSYLNRGWSFSNPDAIEQCAAEHWTDKIHEQANEGCNLAGKITVNKVIGNFHISPGRSYLQNHFNVQELVPYLKDGNPHGFGHIIHQFSFENEGHKDRSHLTEEMKKRLGIVYSPLDTSGSFNPQKNYMYQYFLKVVGTRYHFLDESFASGHQFSVTNYERDLAEAGAGKNNQGAVTTHGITGIPGVFFNFEISPMMVVHHERRQSFAHFLTSMCAIVGGVLTVASILDSFLFRTQKFVKKTANNTSGDPVIATRSGFGSSVKMM